MGKTGEGVRTRSDRYAKRRARYGTPEKRRGAEPTPPRSRDRESGEEKAGTFDPAPDLHAGGRFYAPGFLRRRKRRRVATFKANEARARPLREL